MAFSRCPPVIATAGAPIWCSFLAAARIWSVSVTANPVNADAYRELGNDYEALGRPVDAEATYKQAIQMRPNYWASYSDLGRFYYQLARYEDAAAQFRRVIELTPDNPRGYSGLGGMYFFLKRYDDANAMYANHRAYNQG